jgi:hypothetical protein
MAYVTIEKDGEPCMFCRSTYSDEIKKRIEAAKAETPTSTFTHRISTLVVSQHCANVMDLRGRFIGDPIKYRAVPVIDDQDA